jgi:WD40 repeat protein
MSNAENSSAHGDSLGPLQRLPPGSSTVQDDNPSESNPQGNLRATRLFQFDAFISYGHGPDGAIASALQNRLNRFAKRWYQVRSLRTFRDESSLSVSPGLWPSITAALDDSRYMILLASPRSAESEWVSREVEHFLSLGRISKLLIALTEGDIAWDDGVGDFDWKITDALPTVLKHKFTTEPRLVDLRWARDSSSKIQSDPRLVAAVADLSATIQGVPKDQLIGEDIRQYKILTRWRNSAIAALAILLAITMVATIVTFRQRDVALQQRNIALSRQLMIEAGLIRNDQPDLAALLDVESWHITPTNDVRASLMELSSAPEYRNVITSSQFVRATFSPDGRFLATVADWGSQSVTVWDTLTHTQLAPGLPLMPGPITNLAFSPDGTKLAVATGRQNTFNILYGTDTSFNYIAESTTVLDLITGSVYAVFGTPSGHIFDLEFAPDGKTLYAATGFVTVDQFIDFSPGRVLKVGGGVDVLDLNTKKRRTTLIGKKSKDGQFVDAITIAVPSPDGKNVALFNHYSKEIFFYSTATWSLERVESPQVPAGQELEGIGFMQDGRLITYSAAKSSSFSSTLTPSTLLIPSPANGNDTTLAEPDAMRVITFSSDNQTIMEILKNSNTITLWDASKGIVLARFHSPVDTRFYSPADSGDEAAASSDISKIAVSTSRGTELWYLNPKEIVDRVCKRVRRNLSQVEWNTYVGASLPYEETCHFSAADRVGISPSDRSATPAGPDSFPSIAPSPPHRPQGGR